MSMYTRMNHTLESVDIVLGSQIMIIAMAIARENPR